MRCEHEIPLGAVDGEQEPLPEDEVKLHRPHLADVFDGEQDDPEVVVDLLDLGALGALTDVLSHQRVEAQEGGDIGEVRPGWVGQVHPHSAGRIGQRGRQVRPGSEPGPGRH